MTIYNKNPLVSIIICAYALERYQMILDCIDSILHNDYKNYEIILVIDGNNMLKQKLNDKFMMFDNIKIIENKKNEGPSISRNRAIEIANGDIVAFIDDDAFAMKNWLELIVKNFCEYSEIYACGGKLLPMYDIAAMKLPEELLWTVGCTYKGHPENKTFVRNVISANMAVRKKVFNYVQFEKMFDGKNWKMEDTLFGIRLSIMKKDSVLYDPKIVVYHNVSKDRTKLKYLLERSYSEGKLKYDLSCIIRTKFTDKQVFNLEQNYIKILLFSIFRKCVSIKFKDALLIILIMSGTIFGYLIRRINSR